MKKIIIIIGILLLFMCPAVSAWGPATHTYITDELLGNPEGNQILTMCASTQDNIDAFTAGSEIPDITVVYYFEHGGEKYVATHNWNFQQSVMSQAENDREMAFAYGIAQHLISDSVAHQIVIPDVIVGTHVPNWIVHPLAEQKYDSQLKGKYLYLEEKSKHMFDAILYGPYGDRYIEMLEIALSKTSQIDVEDHVIKLAQAFDSFYDPENGSFTPSGVNIFGFYPIISGIADFVSPLTVIAGQDKMDAALDKTLELNREVFNNWGSRHALIPHGFDDLHAADEEGGTGNFTIYFTIFSIIIITVPIGLYLWKKNPLFLLLMPLKIVLLLGWIAFIYLSI